MCQNVESNVQKLSEKLAELSLIVKNIREKIDKDSSAAQKIFVLIVTNAVNMCTDAKNIHT